MSTVKSSFYEISALYEISSKPSVARVPAADKVAMKQLVFEASMDKLLARQAARDSNVEDIDYFYGSS